ncbi:rRNA-processing protein FCF1 [Aeromonas caviae]|uniref:PIN domain-containing protein n=1 Tax=Aeromonas caviae TaxID=648 RepID=UPI00209E7437|nr:PIN domain-containing protein [Aeromonas caviae]MCP1598992.1 rRNA-processing protein FCF1 [Aeromonas caviae]
MFDNIILDTNILHKDYNLRSNDLKKIVKIAGIYKTNICIPQIVIDECLGQYTKEFNKTLRELSDIQAKLSRILLDKKANEVAFDKLLSSIKKKESEYKTWLESFIKDKRINIVPYSSVSHQNIVNAIYSLRHPFTENGKEQGYKDYMLALSVMEKYPNSKSIIYTKNIKDFAGAKQEKSIIVGLHPDFSFDNCKITDNLPSLIQALHKNNNHLSKSNISEVQIESFIEQLVDDLLENILYKDELYGELVFDPVINKNTLYHQVLDELIIEGDSENDLFSISGKLSIDFTCNFEIDNYDMMMFDENFVFYDIVEKMASKKYKDDDEWKINLYDIRYKATIEFTYDLFDAGKSPLDKYDEYSLIINRLTVDV